MVMQVLAPLMPFFDVVRPTRSPFVLIAIILIVCLLHPLSQPIDSALYYVPLYTIVGLTFLLSFRYNPPELIKIDSDMDADASSLGDLASELDRQFKFARAACVSIGVVSLYLLMSSDQTPSNEFYIAYISILTHLAVFSTYMVLKTTKEESPKSYAVFQVGFLTGLFLLAAVNGYLSAQMSDGSYLYNCDSDSISNAYPCGRSLDWVASTSLVFWVFWLGYIVFWLQRMKHFFQLRAKR